MKQIFYFVAALVFCCALADAKKPPDAVVTNSPGTKIVNTVNGKGTVTTYDAKGKAHTRSATKKDIADDDDGDTGASSGASCANCTVVNGKTYPKKAGDTVSVINGKTYINGVEQK